MRYVCQVCRALPVTFVATLDAHACASHASLAPDAFAQAVDDANRAESEASASWGDPPSEGRRERILSWD